MVVAPAIELAENGFGYWYDDTTNLTLPSTFNHLQALRIIGYDIKDSVAAIGAFKRHFTMQDKGKTLTDEDRKILYNLSLKYQ